MKVSLLLMCTPKYIVEFVHCSFVFLNVRFLVSRVCSFENMMAKFLFALMFSFHSTNHGLMSFM